MDYKPIRIALILVFIFTGSVAFRTGIYAGRYYHASKAFENSSETLLFDTTYQTGLSAVTDSKYRDSLENEHPIQYQNNISIVEKVNNDILSMYQFPILGPEDFRERQDFDHDRQVIVAIIDTGIDADHEALYPAVTSQIDFTNSPVGVWDKYGHGTHIAGIIAANSENNPEIQGIVPGCRLLNVKIVDDRGRYNMSDLVAGIIWAVDSGANIINISIVSDQGSAELEAAIDYAWDNGALVVAAAGNGGTDVPVYPAAYEHSIAVTAADDNGNLIPLANYGNWVDIAAPGYKIYSTLPGNSYGYLSGTSFATAYVSGLAATIFSMIHDANNDGKINDEVRQFILNNFVENPIKPVRN